MPTVTSIRVALCCLVTLVLSRAGVCPSAPTDRALPDLWAGHPDVHVLNRRVNQIADLVTTQMQAITKISGRHTISNTLCPYDRAKGLIQLVEPQTLLLRSTYPDAALRQAASQAEQRIQQLKTSLELDRSVYLALAAIDRSRATPAERHYLEREIKAYQLAGVDRDNSTRQNIVSLRGELVRLGQQFQKNIVDGGSQLLVKDKEDLRGLPRDFLISHPSRPDGSMVLTTEPGDAVPVITYAQSATLRRRMFLAWVNQGYPANRNLLRQMAEKRSELAHALGFPNWAEYASADQMSGSAEAIRKLISQVEEVTREPNALYQQELLALKRKDDPQAAGLHGEDSFYYADQLKRVKQSFQAQELRPYFPYEQTEKGLLDIAAQLFHVSIARVNQPDMWDPSVSAWEVYSGGKLLGRFFLDMHPRSDKDPTLFSMIALRPGIVGEQIPEGALLCNFPASQPGAPALLDYSAVVVLFHELGHLMNQMLGTQPWAGLSGLAAERDFVEVPSQMLEEWMKDPTVLQRFAKHYQTGQTIPSPLLKALTRADRIGRASNERTQIWFSDFALQLHTADAGTTDPEQLWKQTYHHFFPAPEDPEEHGYVHFIHWIYYTSNYYTYSWDRVVKWDFLSQFDPAHLMADDPTWKYRHKILEPGSSKPAAELVTDFLGRAAQIGAYQRWINEEYGATQPGSPTRHQPYRSFPGH